MRNDSLISFTSLCSFFSSLSGLRTQGFGLERCPILYVRGRQHPVKIYHTEEDSDQYEDLAVRTFFQIHTARPDGDVLIFLSGSFQRISAKIPLQMH